MGTVKESGNMKVMPIEMKDDLLKLKTEVEQSKEEYNKHYYRSFRLGDTIEDEIAHDIAFERAEERMNKAETMYFARIREAIGQGYGSDSEIREQENVS